MKYKFDIESHSWQHESPLMFVEETNTQLAWVIRLLIQLLCIAICVNDVSLLALRTECGFTEDSFITFQWWFTISVHMQSFFIKNPNP